MLRLLQKISLCVILNKKLLHAVFPIPKNPLSRNETRLDRFGRAPSVKNPKKHSLETISDQKIVLSTSFTSCIVWGDFLLEHKKWTTVYKEDVFCGLL